MIIDLSSQLRQKYVLQALLNLMMHTNHTESYDLIAMITTLVAESRSFLKSSVSMKQSFRSSWRPSYRRCSLPRPTSSINQNSFRFFFCELSCPLLCCCTLGNIQSLHLFINQMASPLVEVENQVFDVTCVLSLTSFLSDDRENFPSQLTATQRRWRRVSKVNVEEISSTATSFSLL